MSSKFIFILTLSLCYNCFGQHAPTGMMSAKSALNDLAIIRKSIDEVHPGLDRFGQRGTFIAAYDSLFKAIERQDFISSMGFFRAVNPVLTKVKCGHTKFFPPMKDFPFYYYQDKLLPFIVRFDDQMRLLIVKSKGDFTGKYIESINGQHIDQIVNMLRTNMFVDGDIQASADAQIQQYFSAWYADFIQDKEVFDVILKDSKNVNMSISVAGTTVADWKKLNDSYQGISVENGLTFKSDSTAYLRIASFSPATSNKDFQKFLSKSFDDIAKKPISNLIIDVRGNEGGNDMLGKELYAHIARDNFKYYDHIEVAVRRKKDITYRNIAYIPKFAGLATLFIKKQKDGRLFWKKHQNFGIHHPKRNAYKGNVTFLADGLSYSVTSEFLAVAKSESRGIFVGTESGGAYEGDNSGTFVIFKLPGSTFNLGLPVAAYYSAVKSTKKQGRGILPDYQLFPSSSDLLTGQDTILDFALTNPPSLRF